MARLWDVHITVGWRNDDDAMIDMTGLAGLIVFVLRWMCWMYCTALYPMDMTLPGLYPIDMTLLRIGNRLQTPLTDYAYLNQPTWSPSCIVFDSNSFVHNSISGWGNFGRGNYGSGKSGATWVSWICTQLEQIIVSIVITWRFQQAEICR